MEISRKRELAALARQTVGEAMATLRGSENADGRVHREDGRDIKLEADLLLSRELTRRLAKSSGLPCLSEEDVSSHGLPSDAEPVWIVDPLDGSMNFARGLPLHCVSIALWQGEEALVGVIHDIARGETMAGYDDFAETDGVPMRVRREADVAMAVLATGFPLLADTSPESSGWFLRFADAFKKVRMFGSAALSMAWVAQGKLDAYFEKDIMIWDIAAGAALVRGAGGVCDIRPGRFPLSRDVLATNAKLATSVREILGWKQTI